MVDDDIWMNLATQSVNKLDAYIDQQADQLCKVAVRSLVRMYDPQTRTFCHCIRRGEQGDQVEGTSVRYAATVLIGLAEHPDSLVCEVLHGQSADDVCATLIAGLSSDSELGEVALTLWAARAMNHADASQALEALRAAKPQSCDAPTVEIAWSLSALVADANDNARDDDLAKLIANRLLRSFNEDTALFSHVPFDSNPSAMRAHVACFADLVYPIQALSFYYQFANDTDALAAATRCGQRMCDGQGEQGQWWWHHDVRTGQCIEQYPVYSVHQDSMAPMALLALRQASGVCHADAISRGLEWLENAPEIDGSLFDKDADLIWRKVARREPGKLVRGLQATASKVHPSLRVPAANTIFPPTYIDYETRPYHMGWILYAWSKRFASAPQSS
ncbi:MAG: hypothetical protein DHS20C16_09830 [Phycisphaerae bacterium]|nr:MAG: hypothetical protein DHS20C16_09830 [Phycisphaerae bacterium]